MKSAIIVGVLLCCGLSARGQNLEVRAGTSSLVDADGASAIYSTDQSASEIDFGIAQSRLVFGAGVHFLRYGCDWFAGDHQVNYSTVAAGLAAASRGAAVECKNKKRSLQVFLGATGDTHATAYFTAQMSRHFGSGIDYAEKFGSDFDLTAVASFAGEDKVFLEGLDYRHDGWSAQESAGLANGQEYFEAVGLVQKRHFAANVTHADYFDLARMDAEQVSAGTQWLSVFASAFQSKHSGEAFGGNVAIGRVSATVMSASSDGVRETTEFVTERLSPRFAVNQSISGRNVGVGGSMIGNFLTASVSYQELFSPVSGFERAMTIDLRIQLTRGTLNASVNVLPSGIFYTGYAGISAQGPSLANGAQDHTAQ